MSYNTHIYFADVEFPRAQWSEVLALFDTEFLSPAHHRWVSRSHGGSVVCELLNVIGKNYINAGAANWCIITDCTKRARDVSCCARFAYTTLLFIEGARWDDGYFELCARSSREFEEICVPRLERWFVAQGISKMFDLGILNGDGKLKL